MRLFFALLPTPAQAQALVAEVAPLVKELDGQPSPASNLHATLCFVGTVADERLAALRETAATVRARHVALDFCALDVWEKPQILCATAEDSNAARDLSERLTVAVSAAGFTPDRKPLRAHLTLARKVRRDAARNFAWPRAFPTLGLRCDRFVLMESRRDDTGSTYSVVDSWPLDEK
jgi:2'-5' RNA ligase